MAARAMPRKRKCFFSLHSRINGVLNQFQAFSASEVRGNSTSSNLLGQISNTKTMNDSLNYANLTHTKATLSTCFSEQHLRKKRLTLQGKPNYLRANG